MTDRKQSYREVLGARLKAFRVDRGLSAYAVARDGAITISQVNAVEDGVKNYTIETFLGYISVSGLYMYFAEKEHTGEGHDFECIKNAYCFKNLLAKSSVRSLLRFCVSLLL